MSSIWQCEYDISRYRKLKSKLNFITSRLYSTINSTESLTNRIDDKYLLDDDSVNIVKNSIQLKNDINSTYNYLKNKIIPAIDVAINNLRSQISRLEYEEQQRLEENKL